VNRAAECGRTGKTIVMGLLFMIRVRCGLQSKSNNLVVPRKKHFSRSGAARVEGCSQGAHFPRSFILFLQLFLSCLLQELCLVAMESFVQRCPAASRPHADTFASAVLRYSKYDPNYAASDDDEEAMDEENDAATYDEYEEEEEAYSDDEDSSWKVRRVAAKLAMALVAHYQDILKELYSKFNQLLLVRLKEREEAVRPDVYGAYTDLVMAMGGASRRGDQEASEALKRDVPAALRALSRQLKSRSVKTKALALKALQELARAAPGSVAEGLATVIAGVKLALEDATAGASSLKLEALHFLNTVLSFANPRDMQLHAPTLTPLVGSLASDRYYIVSAEALRACERFAYVLRPDCSLPVGAELAGLSTQLAEAATERLRASEIAQEVKEAAISCSAAVIARLGDAINGSASQVSFMDCCGSQKDRVRSLRLNLW
jgi:cullin-associated NEDD8-dissociated protein 1